jgi:CRP-like cAMP-binding protein
VTGAAPRQAAGIVSRLPLFRHVSREHLDMIQREAKSHYFRRGDVVARHGEMVQGLVAVAYGMVKLALHGAGGAERVIRLVGPSQTFGEVVTFMKRPLPVDAVAVVDTRIVIVPAEPLLALVSCDAHFALNLIASLSERMHALICDFEATTMHGATERLAAYLESLAEAPEATRVTLPAPKKLIAARLGMTKETFSRTLHELAQSGLVSVAGREVILLDRARLARAAGLEA